MSPLNNGANRYKDLTDRDLALITAVKLDAISDKVDAFIMLKENLQKTHECRMDQLENMLEDHGTRLNTLEVYFKVAVGALVVGVGVFGVYLVDLMVG